MTRKPRRFLGFILKLSRNLRVLAESLLFGWGDSGVTAHRILKSGFAIVHTQLANTLTAWISHRRKTSEIHSATLSVRFFVGHANSRLTLDVYAQALTPAKRAAHLKLVELIEPMVETQVVPLCSHAEDAVSVSD